MTAEPLLVETIESMLGEQCTPERVTAAEGSLDAELWQLLDDSGLTLVGVAESIGGSGGTRHDLAAIVTAAGRHAAPVPLVANLAAAVVVEQAGVDLPGGPLALAVVGPRQPEPSAVRVPWGAASSRLCVVTEAGLHVVPTSSAFVVERGANLAGEPWLDIDRSGVGAPVGEITPADARLLGALVQSLAVAGALERAVDLSVRYAAEREQFGRPIGRFQAIQQQLAQAAGEVVAAGAAACEAVDVWADGGRLDEVVATAQAVGGAATGVVTRIAHQVHGAIGFTDEHRLQLTTRRLWAWRDEHGTEAEWATRLGRAALRSGGEALWPSITG